MSEDTVFFKHHESSVRSIKLNRKCNKLEQYCQQFDYLTPADDNREGFRVSFDKAHGDGWLLLRMSVHDPVLPLNIESNSQGGVAKIEAFFDKFISQYDDLRS